MKTDKKSLILANNLPEPVFRKLLENCFAVLTGFPEPHGNFAPIFESLTQPPFPGISSLYNSKPDLIKELYAALLSITANFVQTGQNKDSIVQFLTQCNYSGARTSLYVEFFEKNRCDIEASLINIGNHLPHITDITWKIDYVIKVSWF